MPMDLGSLISNDKEIEVNYPDPDLEGFVVTLNYASRDDLQAIRKKCLTSKYSKKTHKVEEELDDDLFLKLYIKKVLVGWKGLKYKYLLDLMTVDLGSVTDLEEELEFNDSNALILMKNSVAFDAWVTEVIGDVSVFNKND